LNLGVPYTVAGYPTGNNAATGLPWSPATDGLRNITGRVNANGTVTIWAITSTVSGSGDQGADPNQLVTITDTPSATTPSSGETFTTVLGGLCRSSARRFVHARYQRSMVTEQDELPGSSTMISGRAVSIVSPPEAAGQLSVGARFSSRTFVRAIGNWVRCAVPSLPALGPK
jgi:hypothetical protein